MKKTTLNKNRIYDAVMFNISRTVKHHLRTLYESSDDITISNHKYTTEEIIKISKKYGFELFKENFNKNNNSFPYINSDKVKYVVVVSGDKICGILAYGNSEDVKKRRIVYEDEYHLKYAHIFDLETLEEYRGKGIARKLIENAIEEIQDDGDAGITLQAIDKETAKMYQKFGFTIYKNAKSPLMELTFQKKQKISL